MVPAKPIELPDAHDRRIAVETFDHNLVVTAGAGTGKTTLLVDRIVHLFDGLIVEEEAGSERREIREAKRELAESGFGAIQ